MSDVFVSYASADRERVIPIVQAIERRGWTVWWDRKIGAGNAFDREIEKALDEARCIIVVWSEASIESDWVRNEATEGLERGILIPVLLDAIRPPLAFRRTQTIDLTASSTSLDAVLDAVLRICPIQERIGGKPSPLVGRDDELTTLQTLLRRTEDGQGGTVVLSGEAGVGKTRLVEEAASMANERDMLVLSGRCEIEDSAPYQPLLGQIEHAMRRLSPEGFRQARGENAPELAKLMPALRQQFPEIPEPISLPTDQERRYLLHGCGTFIERVAQIQPVLLVFEDLHWAGESTCHLFKDFAERLSESRVLIIGTYRDTEVELGRPFAQVLQSLLKERLAQEVPLERLDPGHVGALLEGRAMQNPPDDLVSLIFEATEGNPFFIEEMYRHLEESNKLFLDDGRFASALDIPSPEVPRGVRLMIEQRLARVTKPCSRLLRIAAVKGRVVSFPFLASIGDLSEDELFDVIEEAERASLLEDVSVGRTARYQFVHEQTRQTVISSLSLPRRQRIHLAIANNLEASQAANDQESTAEIAFHLYQAGDSVDAERTSRFLTLASQQAIDAVAFEDALELLARLDELADGYDQNARARIQAMRGQALRGAGRIDEALEALAVGIASGESLDVLAPLLLQRGTLLVDLYRGEDSLPDLEKLLTIARSERDTELEFAAQRLLSDAYYRISLDNPSVARRALDECERSIEIARTAQDQNVLARSLIQSADFVDYWADYRETASRNLAEANTIAKGLGDEDLLLDCATMELRVAAVTPLQFSAKAEDVLRRLEKRRDPIRLKEHLFCMIHPSRNAGHLERSVEICDRAIELAEQLGVPPVQYPTLKSYALIALGKYEEAWASIEQEVVGEGYRFASALQRYGFFYFRSQLGDTEVLNEMESLLAECRSLNRIWMVESIVDIVATLASKSGSLNKGLSLLDALAPDINLGAQAAAEVVLARGNVDDALAQANQLRESCKASAMRLLEADAVDLAIRCLVRLERFEEARQEADHVIEFCRETGYLHLLWRLLVSRMTASAKLGDSQSALHDRQSAKDMANEIARRIPKREHQQAFLAQPLMIALSDTGQ
jgi:tetratricopeptide (TPR) repeat protein